MDRTRNMLRKTLVFFSVFDKEGRVDPYVLYLAKALKKYASYLVILFKSSVKHCETEMLQAIADKYMELENTGFDFGAYKAAFEKIGWNEIDNYNELILVNDSCYGPIFELEELFEKMDRRNNDFWGITLQPPIHAGNYSDQLLPEHLQSYFLAIESRMLHSKEFKDFWNTAAISNDYMQTVWNFELRFTEYFKRAGYTYSAYVDSHKFVDSYDETQAYVFYDTFRLVSEGKCPFLKKKAFTMPHSIVLSSNQGETAYKTLRFVDDNTGYDSNLIYENLIRIMEPYELYLALHLDYVVSECPSERCNEAAVVWLGDGYKEIPVLSERNIIVYGTAEDLKKNRVELSKYTAVCFLNSACSLEEIMNCIGSGMGYLNEVAKLFEENPFLGALFGGEPHDGSNGSFGKGVWLSKEIFNKLVLDEMMGNQFMALQSEEEFDALLRFVKKHKKYSGRILNAAITSKRLQYYMTLMERMYREKLTYNGIREVRELRLIDECIYKYAVDADRVFIYGTGDLGNECLRNMSAYGVKIENFLVSDGYYSDEFIGGIRVKRLSDVSFQPSDLIIVAVNKNNLDAIHKSIVEKGGALPCICTYEKQEADVV